MIRSLFVVLLLARAAAADPISIRCDEPAQDLAIDGLLDDWPKQVAARAGSPPDNGVALRCAWDGTALTLALDIADDRVVRVKSGTAHEDHVGFSVFVANRPASATVYPGNAIAKSRVHAWPHVQVADSLQPKGFSVEARFPAASILGYSPSTPALLLTATFHDSDQATGGDDTDVVIEATIELGAQKDLFDDFLRATKLRRTDLRFDAMAKLDPDRAGKQRVVAGGAVIGVITEQFAYAQLPVARAADVIAVELLPLGPRGQQVIAARFRQPGREVLGLWTVWSGQLQPLAQIELVRTDGDKRIESSYRVAKGRLLVEPKLVRGWTAATWPDETMADLDPIVTPWEKRGGVGYSLTGAEVTRRDLPKHK